MLRKPNSIPSSDTVITDDAFGPFFITRSTTGGYAVYENVIKGENKTKYIKTICYPSKFAHAIKIIAEELLNQDKTFPSARSYIQRYEDISKELTSIAEL